MRHGRTKGEKAREVAERERAARLLEGKRLAAVDDPAATTAVDADDRPDADREPANLRPPAAVTGTARRRAVQRQTSSGAAPDVKRRVCSLAQVHARLRGAVASPPALAAVDAANGRAVRRGHARPVAGPGHRPHLARRTRGRQRVAGRAGLIAVPVGAAGDRERAVGGARAVRAAGGEARSAARRRVG
ncbi:MAG: hypothetical protein IPN17_35250 [Deltaproteobacteria bacterium]|nr:hypothetical protein [Deltaproteobacteria bacterium]